MNNSVLLRIPAKKEFIKAARLMVSGLASEADYNVEDIEDIKTCVAEAFILMLCGQECSQLQMEVHHTDKMEFVITGEQPVAISGCDDCTGFSEEISKVMISSLSENASFEEKDGLITKVSFTK